MRRYVLVERQLHLSGRRGTISTNFTPRTQAIVLAFLLLFTVSGAYFFVERLILENPLFFSEQEELHWRHTDVRTSLLEGHQQLFHYVSNLEKQQELINSLFHYRIATDSALPGGGASQRSLSTKVRHNTVFPIIEEDGLQWQGHVPVLMEDATSLPRQDTPSSLLVRQVRSFYNRLTNLDKEQKELLERFDMDVYADIKRLESVVAHLDTKNKGVAQSLPMIEFSKDLARHLDPSTGLDPAREFASREVAMPDGVGGPFFSLHQNQTAQGLEEEYLFQLPHYSGYSSPWLQSDTWSKLGYLSKLQKIKRALPIMTPLAYVHITSQYGVRLHPFTKRKEFHPGIDLGGAHGTPVMTPLDGTVNKVGYQGAYGRVVEVNHHNGFKTRYGHLGKAIVKKGQKVYAGQTLGHVGSTGRSTGPHLHYEVWYNGVLQDPTYFIEAGRYLY